MRIFYDLTCPFCYLAQPLNKRLLASGAILTELPFQAHPEIPREGIHMGPRTGPMYDSIAVTAKAAGLPLKWRGRLPNSRLALAAAEWTRRTKPEVADEVRERLFHAHFAGDQDIGDKEVVLDVLESCGLERSTAESSLRDGTAMRWVDDAERLGKSAGVRSTPSWESNGTVVSGLREAGVRELLHIEQAVEVGSVE